MSITRSHSDAGSATTGPTVPVPADATQCWRPPVASLADLDRAGDVVLLGHVARDGPHVAPSGASARSSATAASSRSWLRPASVTDAPSRSRWRAAASPMPLPPPVISPAVPASTSSPISIPLASVRPSP